MHCVYSFHQGPLVLLTYCLLISFSLETQFILKKRPWLIFPNKHFTYSKISLVVAGAKWPLHPACPCALTTYRAQVPTWQVEGGRATVMSCPLPLLFLLRLWCQVQFRGWALLQGGEFTEEGTCPGPLPCQFWEEFASSGVSASAAWM